MDHFVLHCLVLVAFVQAQSDIQSSVNNQNKAFGYPFTSNKPVGLVAKQSYPSSYSKAMVRALSFMAHGNVILEQDDNATPRNPYDDSYIMISETGKRVELTYREITRIRDVNHRLNSIFATDVGAATPAITTVLQGKQIPSTGVDSAINRNLGNGSGTRSGRRSVSIGFVSGSNLQQRSHPQFYNRFGMNPGRILGLRGLRALNFRQLPFGRFPHMLPPHFINPFIRRRFPF
ncbi:hypothetical protein SNE40_002653 [Patella caerulea]|uniref:Uncharacterized protein n=1 Tax=Patella caerulea TaxID=87958 RepID=A0AAN8QEG3_PATCE